MTDPIAVPAWWSTLESTYTTGVAHAFVLHGNVRDVVPMSLVPRSVDSDPVLMAQLAPAPQDQRVQIYTALRPFLTTVLGAYDVVIIVDPASGMTIPIPAHRDTLAGALQADKNAPETPIVGALRTGRSHAAMMNIRDVSAFLDYLLTTPPLVPSSRRPIHVAVIFDYGDYMLPDVEIARTDAGTMARFIKWATDMTVGQHHRLIILTEVLSSINPEIRRASARWEAIEIPLPVEADRVRFINSRRQISGHTITDDHVNTLARATGGLMLLQVEDVMLSTVEITGADMWAAVQDRKRSIIKREYGDVLELPPSSVSFAGIGGYSYLINWLRDRVVRPWQHGKLSIGGLLLSGPPGTGKTQLAAALATELGCQLVVLRFAKILHRYVGDSERNLERVLQAIMALAPTVVFIDEVDQVLTRGTGQSEVNSRLFARLLEWMEAPERRGQVLVVTATNRPDLLDAAVRSRFDRTVPMLPPIDTDRAAILSVWLNRQNLAAPSPETMAQFVASSHRWVGRTIRDFTSVVGEYVAEGVPIDAAIAEALTVYTPSMGEIEDMTRAALATITDRRLVPPEYRPDATPAPTPIASRRWSVVPDPDA